MLKEGHSNRISSARVQEVCAELEQRLSADDGCRAESILATYPELRADPEAALEVVYTEFVAREQLGQRPEPSDFLERFPQWRSGLEQVFEIHRAGGSAGEVLPAPPVGTPFPDGRLFRSLAEPGVEGAGRRIANYELLGEIGRGGMGVVYKARQIGLNRLVALKMILTGADAGPQERARFRAEAEAAARLQHANIVQIHEVGEHEGRAFLCLEYVDGGNLENQLTGVPWQAADAVQLVEMLARAIHHAHQQGVVHRDLKPANVLLMNGGMVSDERSKDSLDAAAPFTIHHSPLTPKITDFGLARRLPTGDTGVDAATGLTHSGAIVGTPAYMAPEQAAGDGREVGPAADVHALGAILYEFLTGRPPFQGMTVLETLEQVRSRDPIPPARLMPGLPRDVETICLNCLRKEPSRRYESAAALADDLGRFLRGEPVRARPTPFWERAWKWARRRPAVATLLAVLTAVTVSGLVSTTLLWRQTAAALLVVKKERDEKEVALAVKLVALAQNAWVANDLEAARRHLDECPPAHRGPQWRYLHRVCHACLRVLGEPDSGQKFAYLAWSADGRYLASTGSRHEARVWEAETGRERSDLPLEAPGTLRLAFGPEGQAISLYFSAPNAADLVGLLDAKIWDFETRAELRKFTAPMVMYAHALSGDTRRLAVAGDKALALIDLGSGATLVSVPNLTPPVVLTAALNADGRLLAWSTPKAVFVWDTAKAKRAGPALPQRGDHLTFSPDGECLAVCGNERDRFRGAAAIWDFRAGRKLVTMHGHNNYVLWSAYSPDGRHLATASADMTVKVWEVATGYERFTFRGHLATVTGVEFSPDGMRLASSSLDGTVRIWDARPLSEQND